jgi:tetratricopeptide (TPR) repeat protein
VVKRRSLGALLAVLVARGLVAQEGELGRIDFPTSGSESAQKNFLRGALLLHSFEFDDAADEFRAAQKLDPNFAMAYWGEAMTYNHPLWREVDPGQARKALEKLAPTPEARQAKATTEREKMYLAAVEALYGKGDKAENDRAYAEAMRRLHEKYPDDENAAAFYSLALLGTCEGKRDYPTYMKAAAVAEEVFARNPLHPGAVHYLIHSYDDPVHAPLGMRAARVYAKIAPAAGHALHMPSHIFFASGMWSEAAASNEAAWKASVDRADRKKLSADNHSYHALFWLEYAYLQQGRYREAREVLRKMEKDAAESGSETAKNHLAMMRAAYVVETRQFDGDVARALPSETKSVAIFAEGLAATASADKGRIVQASTRIAAEKTGEHHGSGGATLYRMGSASSAGADAVMKKQLEALAARADKDLPRAAALGKEAAADEDKLDFEFGPPSVVKPAHELAGELLLASGDAAGASAEFEKALASAPNRALSLLGLARAAAKSGDRAASAEAYRRLASIWSRADADLPETAEVRGTGPPVATR